MIFSITHNVVVKGRGFVRVCGCGEFAGSVGHVNALKIQYRMNNSLFVHDHLRSNVKGILEKRMLKDLGDAMQKEWTAKTDVLSALEYKKEQSKLLATLRPKNQRSKGSTNHRVVTVVKLSMFQVCRLGLKPRKIASKWQRLTVP